MKFPAALLLALAAVASAAPAAASTDLVATVNEIRARGCSGRAGTEPALRRNPALDRVAAALASGDRLSSAMSDAGYVALASAVLEASGNEAAFRTLLATRGCDEILDPAYRELGAAERRGRAWIVLATPLDAPRAADAAAVGREVLKLANRARQSARRCGWKRFDAVSPLAWSEKLARAAQAHARDMAGRGVLSHTGSDGSSASERATRAGYQWRYVGENIAAGQQTAAQVVEEWLGSPRHCANLMDPDFTEMAAGYAFEGKSPKGVYWAQVFGAPRR